MENATGASVSCAVCGRTVPAAEAVPSDFVRPSIATHCRQVESGEAPTAG